MNIHTGSICRPAHYGECAWPMTALAPMGSTARHGCAGWATEERKATGVHKAAAAQAANERNDASAACTNEAPIRAAIHRGDIPGCTTYRTTLCSAQFGRVDLTVVYRQTHIAIRLRCESDASYAWLTGKRPALERHLTRAFGKASQVEVIHGAMP